MTLYIHDLLLNKLVGHSVVGNLRDFSLIEYPDLACTMDLSMIIEHRKTILASSTPWKPYRRQDPARISNSQRPTPHHPSPPHHVSAHVAIPSAVAILFHAYDDEYGTQPGHPSPTATETQ